MKLVMVSILISAFTQQAAAWEYGIPKIALTTVQEVSTTGSLQADDSSPPRSCVQPADEGTARWLAVESAEGQRTRVLCFNPVAGFTSISLIPRSTQAIKVESLVEKSYNTFGITSFEIDENANLFLIRVKFGNRLYEPQTQLVLGRMERVDNRIEPRILAYAEGSKNQESIRISRKSLENFSGFRRAVIDVTLPEVQVKSDDLNRLKVVREVISRYVNESEQRVALSYLSGS